MVQEIKEFVPQSVKNISQDIPHIYTDMNTVPVGWRTYKSTRLNLSQINEIMELAYENAIETETGPIPNYGLARQIFSNTHHIEEGFWVSSEESK